MVKLLFKENKLQDYHNGSPEKMVVKLSTLLNAPDYLARANKI